MIGSNAHKIAFVTGATGGLGRAMCFGLAKSGYRVAAGTRVPVRQAEIEKDNGLIFPIQWDVSDTEMCRSAVDTIIRKYGSIDILVNNAAVGMNAVPPKCHDASFKFLQIDESLWRTMLDVNVLGAFRMTKYVVPHQLDRGWGRLVNITTNLTTMTKLGYSPYGPSKAAVEAASAIWAKELQGTGVTVNVLAPGGPSDTRMFPVGEAGDRQSLIKPERMVSPLLWLVSQAADAVSGRYLAKLWRSDLPFRDAAEAAGAPAAWQ